MSARPSRFQQYRRLLVTYLKPQWPQVLLLTLLLLGSIGLQLVGPQLLRYFIDTAQDATKPLDAHPYANRGKGANPCTGLSKRGRPVNRARLRPGLYGWRFFTE